VDLRVFERIPPLQLQIEIVNFITIFAFVEIETNDANRILESP